MSQEHMGIWTVYDHPTDYPDHYVARWFKIEAGEATPTEHVVTSVTLLEMNSLMGEAGRVFMPRSPDDDENIIGSWI